MKIMKKLMALALASALALTLLTGCGGGGGGGSSSVTINGQTLTLNKSRVEMFERAFEEQMDNVGFENATYSEEITNLLEKAIKEGAKNQTAQQTAANYVVLSGASFLTAPNWKDATVANSAAKTVVDGIVKKAKEDNVDFSNQAYGYIQVKDPKSGVVEIAVMMGGMQKTKVVA